MKQFTQLLWLISAVLSAGHLTANDQQVNPSTPALLPSPQSIEWSRQTIEIMKAGLTLPKASANPLKLAQLKREANELFKRNNITASQHSEQQIVFRLGKVTVPKHWKGQEREAYELIAEERGVVITANHIDGLYHGLQTLRQLIVHKNGKTTVASCKITDYPAFKIRGFMHDVGRNFQTIEQLKMQIDIMAAYKYNIFHWHLTDHFGWRLESKIFPDLQSKKAFGRHHGKFYTQNEFKDMVDYCWARGIRIIPEFDSPGHSEAFRHGLNIKNMKDPRAKESICKLIDELCTLADKERMPYIHIGTDEVRHKDEYVNADYLPALHQAVQNNHREVIGWWKGMTIKGDTKQIQQSWAQYRPLQHLRHIDSRSNYVNHLESLDFATRMLFQQPCRVPHGDKQNLGGILAHWPDTRVEDEKLTLTNNPVIPAMVAYSEAVWTGIKKDQPEYWACVPAKGTKEYEAFADFENRIAEQRDRFMSGKPFPMVKTHQIEWRLLGPVSNHEVPELERGIIKDLYDVKGKPYRWTKPLYGAAIHTRHFFNFSRHLNHHPKGKDIVWGNTHIYSPMDQEVDAWIAFNTISSSDDRAGAATPGNWGAHPDCNIWLNGKRIDPPKWKTDGKRGKETPLVDQVYSSRQPSKIKLNKGWNTLLVKSARKFKWVFSFSPIVKDGQSYREVDKLRYSATTPTN
ncbi:family 20 glycosylhydrolase [Verrucomicrobiaceae bacterium N1E253]|uniref:beta-N-acetylhexosaminidase n=1 Tax=Oceaniferula marina TaxID=2748318 RepID=A0A851GG37_9BACT|nr:family 20 glycosylhydrolase [Oceaniferula marina]NWK54771.1 family 20 glycosylhydrolase [Oceaniferula marina]